MTPHEKVLEKHKRETRRNFLVGSAQEQAKIRERYKPANLKGIIHLQGVQHEEIIPFSEEEFRMKVKESVNRLHYKEMNKSDKVYYTHLSKGRRVEKLQDKPKNMFNNCRAYLEFMESYIMDAVKENNLAVQDSER